MYGNCLSYVNQFNTISLLIFFFVIYSKLNKFFQIQKIIELQFSGVIRRFITISTSSCHFGNIFIFMHTVNIDLAVSIELHVRISTFHEFCSIKQRVGCVLTICNTRAVICTFLF